MTLLGYLCLHVSAIPGLSSCAHEPGALGWREVPCVHATSHETPESPRTTRELTVFPAGEHYYDSAFAYRITNTIRTRLGRPPSSQLITACLTQYQEAFQALLRGPTVQEAAMTTRTWRDHHGKIYQAAELLLAIQAENASGRSIASLLSCPLNEDDSLDRQGLDTYLSAFRRGMPVK